MVHSIISHLWKRAKMEKKKSLSEQYRVSANDIHEDLCESDSDCEQELDSESEEENVLESAITEEEIESVTTKKNEHYEFVFGSFGHSDLDTISSVPVISVKPTIDATTIKIGEITCIIKGSKSSTVELSQATRTLIDEVAKKEIIVDLVFEDVEHIDFGTVILDRTSSSVNIFRNLDSVLLWFAPLNRDSVSTTTSGKFSIPFFFHQ